MILFDLDDFGTDGKYNCLPKLLELKKILPVLKVNLFTIPMKVNEYTLREMSKLGWIHFLPHGLYHEDNYEFAKLTYDEARLKLSYIPHLKYYHKGFKAPGWQISQGTMEALKEMGFWVAVQWGDGRFNGDVNGPYQPAVIEGLPYYAWREYPKAIHGHTWNCCSNGLEELWDSLIKLPKDSVFGFIDDYVKTQDFSLRPT